LSSVIANYGLFRFNHERFPTCDNRTAVVRKIYPYQESSYGLERVNDFRYNSRRVSGFPLPSERIGFWWMPIGYLSRWSYGTGCRETDFIHPVWAAIQRSSRIFSRI